MTSIVMYSFFRISDSLSKWDWLTINIRGRSHIVRISNGVERESEKNVNE